MTDYLLLIGVVLAGGLLGAWSKKHEKFVPYLISFSGSYLFAVIVFHLLPEIYGHHHQHAAHEVSAKTAGAFILAGLIFQMILEYFSRGIEHAHDHRHGTGGLTAGVVAGLFLHAFAEGLPVHQQPTHHYLYGILVHKLPIALALTAFLIQSGLNTGRIILILVLFSLMTPLGTWAGEHFELLKTYHIYVSAFVAGILTHVSTVIIFESEPHHKFSLQKFLIMLFAFVLAYLN